jgi:hypothetical protein
MHVNRLKPARRMTFHIDQMMVYIVHHPHHLQNLHQLLLLEKLSRTASSTRGTSRTTSSRSRFRSSPRRRSVIGATMSSRQASRSASTPRPCAMLTTRAAPLSFKKWLLVYQKSSMSCNKMTRQARVWTGVIMRLKLKLKNVMLTWTSSGTTSQDGRWRRCEKQSPTIPTTPMNSAENSLRCMKLEQSCTHQPAHT